MVAAVKPEPVEVTWDSSGIEVVWAVEAEWVDTKQGRREYLTGR